MKLIPVVDLQGGVVVAARLGQRSHYAPISTPLAPGSSALADVVAGLLQLYPFDRLYIADLDAITGGGAGNLDQIAALHRDHPGLQLWVDNGLQELDRLPPVARPVIGSESLGSCAELSELIGAYPAALLSLDYLGEDFRGPDGLDRRPECWPAEIILMTLGRVGSGLGPDADRLGRYLAKAAGRKLYAAGGVRNLEDLARLRSLGVAGALVATALHRGAFSAEDIRSLDGS